MTTEPVGGADDAELTASLHALSQSYPELPAAVAERLDSVLAELPELTAPDTAPAPAPAPKPPWWRRRYALASAGLAVVAFLGGGLLFAAQPWQNAGESASGAADHKEDEPLDKFDSEGDGAEKDSAPGEEPSVEIEVDPYTVTYSNRDYRESDLTEARDASTSVDKSALPPELFPLTSSQGKRDGCVVAAAAEFDGTVTSVDFGRYEGEAAMIAVVEADSGDGGTVAAIGVRCTIQNPDLLGSAEF